MEDAHHKDPLAALCCGNPPSELLSWDLSRPYSIRSRWTRSGLTSGNANCLAGSRLCRAQVFNMTPLLVVFRGEYRSWGRAEGEGLRGSTPTCDFLWFPVKSCSSLRQSASNPSFKALASLKSISFCFSDDVPYCAVTARRLYRKTRRFSGEGGVCISWASWRALYFWEGGRRIAATVSQLALCFATVQGGNLRNAWFPATSGSRAQSIALGLSPPSCLQLEAHDVLSARGKERDVEGPGKAFDRVSPGQGCSQPAGQHQGREDDHEERYARTLCYAHTGCLSFDILETPVTMIPEKTCFKTSQSWRIQQIFNTYFFKCYVYFGDLSSSRMIAFFWEVFGSLCLSVQPFGRLQVFS